MSETETDNLYRKLSNARADLNTAHSKIKKLEEKISKLGEKSASSTVVVNSDNSLQVENLKLQVDRLKGDLRNKEARVDSLQQEVAQGQAKIEWLTRQNEALIEKIRADKDLLAREAEMKDLQRRAKVSSFLRKELEDREDNIKRLVQLGYTYQHNIAKLRKELEGSTEAAAKVKADKKAEEKIKELEAAGKAKDARIKELEAAMQGFLNAQANIQRVLR